MFVLIAAIFWLFYVFTKASCACGTQTMSVPPIKSDSYCSSLLKLRIGLNLIIIKKKYQTKMKVLVVGQGGREHVLAWKLAQAKSVSKVFCAPGNAGTQVDAVNIDISATDIDRLLAFAKKEQIDLTVVGPEAPLVDGIVDIFKKEGLRIFGPSKAAAQLEGSKKFSKELMRDANIPTADFSSFNDLDAALHFLQDREEQAEPAFVVKADGLAAGKGVIVCDNLREAREATRLIMEERSFGEAGDSVIIEDRLVGEEVSILAITDGKTIIPLETSQDHKPAHDGDTGPNTGGMGAYSPAPLISPEMMDDIVKEVLVPTIHAMKRKGCPFTGVLYAGLMMTAKGAKVLEFNVRFGDPEAQPVLMRLKTDLGILLKAAADGRLSDIESLEWDERPAVCVVMASEGYPGDYQKGKQIRGIEEANKVEGAKVFHAGTTESRGKIVTNGGRVLGVTAIGDDLAMAKLRAYQAVKCIRWEGAWCRKDISDKARNV